MCSGFSSGLLGSNKIAVLLYVKDFDSGSEIIMSGITIPDMVKIIESHRLNIVSVDMDMESLHVDKDSILGAITERTVMVVVAHLFGSKMEMEQLLNRNNIN